MDPEDLIDDKTTANETAGGDPVAEPKMVPLAAVQEERQRRKALADELAETKRKLDALQKQPPAATPPATGTSDIDDMRKGLAELRAEQRKRSLSNELGVNEQQAEAIAKTMDSLPGLTSKEALDIAKGRNAELFKGQSESGMNPGQQASLRPTPGAKLEPVASDWQQRRKKLAELQKTDSIAADELRNNMIGQLAANALGIPHRKLPI